MLARLSLALARARAITRRGLSRSPLTPGYDCEGDQEGHDSHARGDGRHHGNRPGYVAGVGPDEADNRSHDEHGDHRGQPVQNPSSGHDGEPTPMGRVANRSANPSASSP